MTPMTAAEARQAVHDLAMRCKARNTSPAFRLHIGKIEAAFAAGDLAAAATMIDQGAGQVSDSARLAQLRRNFPGEELVTPDFVASERATGAYHILSEVRHRFGFLTLKRWPSNVDVFRS